MDAVTLALAKAYTNSQRNGYVETVSRNAVPETTMNFQPMEELGGLCAAMITVPFDLNNGETLEVMWDGVKYTCEYTFDEYGQFGDQTMTLESFPFAYSFDPSANMGVFIAANEGDHTFSIVAKSEVVHKIDKMFISGDTILHYSLSGLIDDDVSNGGLPEEDYALLDKAMEERKPVIISIGLAKTKTETPYGLLSFLCNFSESAHRTDTYGFCSFFGNFYYNRIEYKIKFERVPNGVWGWSYKANELW